MGTNMLVGRCIPAGRLHTCRMPVYPKVVGQCARQAQLSQWAQRVLGPTGPMGPTGQAQLGQWVQRVPGPTGPMNPMGPRPRIKHHRPEPCYILRRSSGPSRSVNLRPICHGVLGGGLKSMNILQNPQETCSTNPGARLLSKKSACNRIMDHGVLGGTPKSMNIYEIHKIHAPKVQGHACSEKKAPAAGSQTTGWLERPCNH